LHRLLRSGIQVVFLALFVFLFMRTRYGTATGVENLFFRFDPLILIFISAAQRMLITSALFSLFIIAGTLVFGRFFCGFVCPLGTILDLTRPVVGSMKTRPLHLKNIKYLILIFLFIAALLGISLIHFFDPLIITARSLALILYPFVSYFAGLVTLVHQAQFTETLIALVFITAIILLGGLAQRFWCRYLCPLGGLLAIISKFSLLKFAFNEGCTQCMICEQVCPTGAINAQEQDIDPAECIGCLRCLHECSQHVIEYRIRKPRPRFDIQRRQIVATGVAGILAVPFVRSFLHTRLHGRLIRPPGSMPESSFLNMCLRCGLCMKACPTNGLQPCVLEAGLNGMWTPRLVPRIGGCEKNCNLCGRVCPTSAIRRLPLEEKTYVKMGTAVIDRSRCIAWEQDKVCLICDEACPFNAISSLNERVRENTLLRPFVDERLCTGCGLCEARCPIEGPAAIEVYSIGEERKRTGTYMTEEKIKLRACEEKAEDLPSGFIIDE
jgi:MauM/NapG family ferredoxin protein